MKAISEIENSVIQRYLASSQHIYKALDVDIVNLQINNELNSAIFSMTFTPKFQAYDGIVHGGVLSFILDSVAGVFALGVASFEGKLALTSKMELKFLKKVELDKEYQIFCEKIDHYGKRFRAQARIVDTSMPSLEDAVIGEFLFIFN